LQDVCLPKPCKRATKTRLIRAAVRVEWFSDNGPPAHESPDFGRVYRQARHCRPARPRGERKKLVDRDLVTHVAESLVRFD
jgi:hypothetical protein